MLVRVQLAAPFDSLRSLMVLGCGLGPFFNVGESNDSERSRSGVEEPYFHKTLVIEFSTMPWHVYIAQAPTGHYYTGITEDIGQRIIDHNEGRGSKFAKDQGELKLLYVSSSFEKKSPARLREMQIKGWTRAKKEKLIHGEWK